MADGADHSTRHGRTGERAKPRQPGRPLTGWKITAAALQKLFDDQQIIRRSLKRPSPEALAELARWVETWRQLALMAPYRLKYDISLEKLGRGLVLIREALPELLTNWQKTESQFHEIAKDIATDKEKALFNKFFVNGASMVVATMTCFLRVANHAHDAMMGNESPLPSSFFVPQGDGDCDHWHACVEELASEFRLAMASTNPGLDLKDSNTGPISRFLSAVIPLITEEKPTPDAIARYLQRERDRKADGVTTSA
jgi:hypothetical protein